MMDIPARLLCLIGNEEIGQNSEKFFMLDQCGFFICLEGTALLSFFNKEYEVKSGSLALFHPFVKIKFREFSDNIKGIWGVRDLSEILPLINQVLSVEDIEAIKSEPVVCLEEKLFAGLSGKIREYLRDCGRPEFGRPADEVRSPLCKALLKSREETLMLELLDCYYRTKTKAVGTPSRRDIVFQKFMMDLQKNYSAHHDTLFYAQRSSLSPKYFTSVVKNVSGAAPTEWIKQTIIAMAQNYLTDTSMTIKEISSVLGFSTQAFFCKYFKRYTSLSPKEYRLGRGT